MCEDYFTGLTYQSFPPFTSLTCQLSALSGLCFGRSRLFSALGRAPQSSSAHFGLIFGRSRQDATIFSRSRLFPAVFGRSRQVTAFLGQLRHLLPPTTTAGYCSLSTDPPQLHGLTLTPSAAHRCYPGHTRAEYPFPLPPPPASLQLQHPPCTARYTDESIVEA